MDVRNCFSAQRTNYVGKIDGDVLKTGKFKNTDWKKWNEAMSELQDTKFYIDDSAGLTVSEVRRKCRKLKNSDDGEFSNITCPPLIPSFLYLSA